MQTANLIVVGGPISVGKSTLAGSLPFPQVPEIDEKDAIQMLLLENTYNKGRVSPEVIENYFLQVRKQKYSDYSVGLQMHVLDRSIFESLWFAKGNMNKESFAHFKKLWEDEINDLIEEFGKPKLYVLLTMKWDTFKERIFRRGRDVEVQNFLQNESFFKEHVAEYEVHMIDVFEKFNVPYVKIGTDNLSEDEVLASTLKSLKEMIDV